MISLILGIILTFISGMFFGDVVKDKIVKNKNNWSSLIISFCILTSGVSNIYSFIFELTSV
jgi:hypothetical protein